MNEVNLQEIQILLGEKDIIIYKLGRNYNILVKELEDLKKELEEFKNGNSSKSK